MTILSVCIGFILGVVFSLLVVPVILFVYEHMKESSYVIERNSPVSTYEEIVNKSGFHNN